MNIEGLSLPAIGDVVADKYRVERILGAGGMGVVLLATHTTIGNKVALKFLRAASASSVDTERFLREARAAGRLSSEHVARVYDAGTTVDGMPFIAMEFIEGGDLSKRLEDPTEILVPDAVEYVLQATEGLIEAHAAGIVHRDLKPQNLVLGRRVNGLPLVKILDFGIAKAIGWADQQLTVSHAVMGSPLYMSPEQMRGIEVDERCDQWAIGVILYELLARRLPHQARTFPELVLKVTLEEPTPLLELAPHVPQELAEIVTRCLNKDRDQRFANIGQLAASLEPFARSSGRGLLGGAWDSSRNTRLTESGAARLQVPKSGRGVSGYPASRSGPQQTSPGAFEQLQGGDVSIAAIARTFPPEEPTLEDLPPEHSTLAEAPQVQRAKRSQLRKRHVFAMSLPGGILVGAITVYAVANKPPQVAVPGAPSTVQELRSAAVTQSATAGTVAANNTLTAHDGAGEAIGTAPKAGSSKSATSVGSIKTGSKLASATAPAPNIPSSMPSIAPPRTSASAQKLGPNGAPILE
jgi:eukaryotic-like serine/threonine-protein kinase